MPRLEWRPAARSDLLDILNYISDDNPEAAQRLKDLIEGQAALLTEFPKRHRTGRVPDTREMIVHPNYVVVYKESVQAVTILRILHAARQWP